MRLTRLRIRHFRSIDDLQFTLEPITILCGPNGCGKSNVMKALDFAFRKDISVEDIYNNLPIKKRDQQGGSLSIWIDMDFEESTVSLRKSLNVTNDTIHYSLKATKGGKVTRSINKKTMDNQKVEQLFQTFTALYVPTIRDPSAGGIEPFKEQFASVLERSRGDTSLRSPTDNAKRILQLKAKDLLGEYKELATNNLRAIRFDIDTGDINLDSLYKKVSLKAIYKDGREVPLNDLGTGHQSLFIIDLYKQLGEKSLGETIYLFEEPDNHLHPMMIRDIGEKIKKLSENSQVLITTHSPLLINFLGLQNVRALNTNSTENTINRDLNFNDLTEKKLRERLIKFSLRISEPFFAKRIIIVEGAFDFHVISKLIEVKFKRTPDQLDILVVIAGGKSGSFELYEVLKSFCQDIYIVFDWDAAFSSQAPYFKDGLSVVNRAKLANSAKQIIESLDDSCKIGRKAVGKLGALKKELLDTNRPTIVAYEGSYVEKIAKVARKLSASDISQLKDSLKNKKVKTYRSLLGKINICLWHGTLEEEMVAGPKKENVVEDVLKDYGKITGSGSARDRKKNLVGILHNSAHEAKLLHDIVSKMEAKKLFNHSEINYVLNFLTEGLEK